MSHQSMFFRYYFSVKKKQKHTDSNLKAGYIIALAIFQNKTQHFVMRLATPPNNFSAR